MRPLRIHGNKLLEMLKQNDRRLEREVITVEGDVRIQAQDFSSKNESDYSCRTTNERLSLKNMNFQKSLVIEGFKKAYIYIEECNLQRLEIRNSNLSSIGIQDCYLEDLKVWKCEAERAFFQELDIEDELDLSGLTLTEGVAINKVSFKIFHIQNPNVSEHILQTPHIKTDNAIIAEQARLMGIKVIMDTLAVQNMMSKQPAAVIA